MGIQRIILVNTRSSTTSFLCKPHQKRVPKNRFRINSISDHRRSYSYLLCHNPRRCYRPPKAALTWQGDAAFLPVAFSYYSAKWLHLTRLTSAERIQKLPRPSFAPALVPPCLGRGVTPHEGHAGEVTPEGNNPLVVSGEIGIGNTGWSQSARVA